MKKMLCVLLSALFLFALPWPVQAAEVLQWGITLNDGISVSFQVSGDAQFTVGGEPVEATKENGLYTIKLAAPQLTEEITVTADGVNAGTYTARDYLEGLIQGEYPAELKALALSLLHYGAAAQTYFGYNTGNLANAGYEDTYTDPGIPPSESLTVTGSGPTFYAASLVYRDKIAIRFYFIGSIEGYSFTVDGTALSPVASGDMHYIEVPSISPDALDRQVELVASDGVNSLAVSYSPLIYISRQCATGSEELKPLLKALYAYHLQAKNYTEYNSLDMPPYTVHVGHLSAHEYGWDADSINMYAPWNDAPWDWYIGYEPTSTDNIKLVRDGNTSDVAIVGAETIYKTEDSLYRLDTNATTFAGGLPIADGDCLIIYGLFFDTETEVTIYISRTYIYNSGGELIFSTAPQ